MPSGTPSHRLNSDLFRDLSSLYFWEGDACCVASRSLDQTKGGALGNSVMWVPRGGGDAREAVVMVMFFMMERKIARKLRAGKALRLSDAKMDECDNYGDEVANELDESPVSWEEKKLMVDFTEDHYPELVLWAYVLWCGRILSRKGFSNNFGTSLIRKDTSVGASGVAKENVVVERGRDPLPPTGGKKGRGQSKPRDAISSLDGRTCVLEEAMGDAKDRLGFVKQNLQTLEDHVLEELESLKKAVTGQDELHTQFMELFANLQEQLDVIKVGVEETRQETAIDYVKEFTTLMLHIPNMTEEDLFFNFIDGLQNWAKQELQRQGVKDIDEAIAVAESLMEYAKAWNKGNNQAATSKSEGHGKLEERRAKSKPKDRCFFRGGPHWARDCPRQGKLNALVEENEEPENQAVHMGSLQILNALHAKAVVKVLTGDGQASTGNGLLYVEAKLNGKPTQVMVDTGATHNFVTMEEAKRLGLKVVGGEGWLKSVNTNAKPLHGVARQVEMCLGSWRGLVDFSVAPMDDFKVVIGLDFLRQAPWCRLTTMRFTSWRKECHVQCLRPWGLLAPKL
ncbi:hypothetical protein RJ640_003789 [Escallonia rubra]|uniref:Retrotransposon gag domain-containing protein n=1 Tax=Escallonia rubra TaxID=112253 RepID=A0AA88UQL5_9ASTE|nr:hypothetical protein RJ640_003789 [Escallonia rubra]